VGKTGINQEKYGSDLPTRFAAVRTLHVAILILGLFVTFADNFRTSYSCPENVYAIFL